MGAVNRMFTTSVNRLLFDPPSAWVKNQQMVDLMRTTTFEERLKLLLDHCGLARVDLAKMDGIGQQNITNWIARGRVGVQGGRRLRAITGVSIDWLNDGVGEMLVDNSQRRTAMLADAFSKLQPEDQDAVFRLVHSLAEPSPSYTVKKVAS